MFGLEAGEGVNGHVGCANCCMMCASSFRERPFRVLQHCARCAVHAELLCDADVSRLLPGVTAGAHNLLYLVTLDTGTAYILSADSPLVFLYNYHTAGGKYGNLLPRRSTIFSRNPAVT